MFSYIKPVFGALWKYRIHLQRHFFLHFNKMNFPDFRGRLKDLLKEKPLIFINLGVQQIGYWKIFTNASKLNPYQ